MTNWTRSISMAILVIAVMVAAAAANAQIKMETPIRGTLVVEPNKAVFTPDAVTTASVKAQPAKKAAPAKKVVHRKVEHAEVRQHAECGDAFGKAFPEVKVNLAVSGEVKVVKKNDLSPVEVKKVEADTAEAFAKADLAAEQTHQLVWERFYAAIGKVIAIRNEDKDNVRAVEMLTLVNTQYGGDKEMSVAIGMASIDLRGKHENWWKRCWKNGGHVIATNIAAPFQGVTEVAASPVAGALQGLNVTLQSTDNVKEWAKIGAQYLQGIGFFKLGTAAMQGKMGTHVNVRASAKADADATAIANNGFPPTE